MALEDRNLHLPNTGNIREFSGAILITTINFKICRIFSSFKGPDFHKARVCKFPVRGEVNLNYVTSSCQFLPVWKNVKCASFHRNNQAIVQLVLKVAKPY